MDDIWLIIPEFVFNYMSCTFFQRFQFFSYLYYIAYRTNVHELKQKKGAIQLGIEMPSFLALNVINGPGIRSSLTPSKHLGKFLPRTPVCYLLI
jgi:hypothetical protein